MPQNLFVPLSFLLFEGLVLSFYFLHFADYELFDKGKCSGQCHDYQLGNIIVVPYLRMWSLGSDTRRSTKFLHIFLTDFPLKSLAFLNDYRNYFSFIDYSQCIFQNILFWWINVFVFILPFCHFPYFRIWRPWQDKA